MGANKSTTKKRNVPPPIFDFSVQIVKFDTYDRKSIGSLAILPKEILLQCLKFLGYKDLCSLNKVSKGI